MQWGAMVQAFEWFILIWVFRLTTKALIQHQVENPFEEPKPKKPSIDDYADMESLLEEEAAMGIGLYIIRMSFTDLLSAYPLLIYSSFRFQQVRVLPELPHLVRE